MTQCFTCEPVPATLDALPEALLRGVAHCEHGQIEAGLAAFRGVFRISVSENDDWSLPEEVVPLLRAPNVLPLVVQAALNETGISRRRSVAALVLKAVAPLFFELLLVIKNLRDGHASDARAQYRGILKERANRSLHRLRQCRVLLAAGLTIPALEWLHAEDQRKPEASNWMAVGSLLAAAKMDAAADRAFALTLALDPKLHVARVARRRLEGRSIEVETDGILCALRNACADATIELLGIETRQLLGGASPVTDYLARHRVHYRIDGRVDKVQSMVEKCLLTRPKFDQVRLRHWPREYLVYKSNITDISGMLFRFPKLYYYLHNSKMHRVHLYIEDIASDSKILDSIESQRRRARALGEFAGLVSADQLQSLFGKSFAAMYRHFSFPFQELVKLLDRAEGLGHDVKSARQSAFRACAENLESRVTGVLSQQSQVACHGDAYGGNLPLSEEGQVVLIDIGGISLGPVGADLAEGLWKNWGTRNIPISKLEEIEKLSLDAYVEGFRAAGGRVSKQEVQSTASAMLVSRGLAGAMSRLERSLMRIGSERPVDRNTEWWISRVEYLLGRSEQLIAAT